MSRTVVLFANTDWYLFNFRLLLARRLRDAGYRVVLVSPRGDYSDRLEREGFIWRSVRLNRSGLGPFGELRAFFDLVRLLKEFQPDVVHGFTIKCAVYAALASRLVGVPARVASVAGLGYVFVSRDVLARLLRTPVWLLMKVAFYGTRSAVVVQNKDDYLHFIEARLVPEERLHIIPGSGVDCDLFSPVTRAVSDRRYAVVLLARMLRDKGIYEFVSAARLVRQSGRDVDFVLAGRPDPGNPASIPEATIAGWVSSGVVRWLGHVEDVPALLRSVDVAVLPSYREGMPKGLLEAGACGLPVVTTDVPGCRDLVSNELDGLLVPPRDPHSIAAAICRLHDDRSYGVSLGSAAREKVVSTYDHRIISDATIALYETMLRAE